jgi:hypothetical protein
MKNRFTLIKKLMIVILIKIEIKFIKNKIELQLDFFFIFDKKNSQNLYF